MLRGLECHSRQFSAKWADWQKAKAWALSHVVDATHPIEVLDVWDHGFELQHHVHKTNSWERCQNYIDQFCHMKMRTYALFNRTQLDRESQEFPWL